MSALFTFHLCQQFAVGMVIDMKEIIKKVIGFFIITVAALECAGDASMGGLGLNGFLAFLIWIVLMAILIKVSSILSIVISVVGYMLIYCLEFGADEKFCYAILLLAGMGACFLFLKKRK